MATTRPPRVIEIYLDARWQRAERDLLLDRETATRLRAEGVTMVRVGPTGLRRLLGLRPRELRDISLSRFLLRTESA